MLLRGRNQGPERLLRLELRRTEAVKEHPQRMRGRAGRGRAYGGSCRNDGADRNYVNEAKPVT